MIVARYQLEVVVFYNVSENFLFCWWEQNFTGNACIQAPFDEILLLTLREIRFCSPAFCQI